MNREARFRAWMVHRGYQMAALIGLVLVAIAVPSIPWPPVVINLLIATGSGLIAGAVVAFLSLSRDELVDRLWDLGVVDLYVNRSELKDDAYLSLLNSSQRHYRALGTANHGYINAETAKNEFQGAFLSAAKRGVKIEILYLQPDGDLIEHRSTEEGRNTKKDALESIQFFSEIRDELDKLDQPVVTAKPSLPDKGPAEAAKVDEARADTGKTKNAKGKEKGPLRDNLKLLQYDLTPACGIVWADEYVVVTHYMPARPNVLAPGVLLRAARERPSLGKWLPTLPWVGRRAELTKVYTGMYDQVRAAAIEMTAERIKDLLLELPKLKGISEAQIRKGT